MLMKSDTIASEMWKGKEICVMVKLFKGNLLHAIVATSLSYVNHFYLHPFKERSSTSLLNHMFQCYFMQNVFLSDSIQVGKICLCILNYKLIAEELFSSTDRVAIYNILG